MTRFLRFLVYLCTPSRLCVYMCTYSCQDSVTSAAACCDWDMVPLGSPPVEIYEPPLCIATVADLYTRRASPPTSCESFLWKCRGETVKTIVQKWFFIRRRNDGRSRAVRNALRRNAMRFTWSFNTSSPPCPSNQFFFFFHKRGRISRELRRPYCQVWNFLK